MLTLNSKMGFLDHFAWLMVLLIYPNSPWVTEGWSLDNPWKFLHPPPRSRLETPRVYKSMSLHIFVCKGDYFMAYSRDPVWIRYLQWPICGTLSSGVRLGDLSHDSLRLLISMPIWEKGGKILLLECNHKNSEGLHFLRLLPHSSGTYSCHFPSNVKSTGT